MREFTLEIEMHDSAALWLSGRSTLVKHEVHTPWGICDIAGVEFNLRHVKHRLSLGQNNPIGSISHIMVFEAFGNVRGGSSVSSDKLLEQLEQAMPHRDPRQLIGDLLRKRFLVKTDDGRISRRDGWHPLQRKVICIELKIGRVEEAVFQAIGNKKIADESYVGLPWYRAHRLMESGGRTLFSRAGIGLLAVSPKTCRTLISPAPKNRTLNESLQMKFVEPFYTSVIDNES